MKKVLIGVFGGLVALGLGAFGTLFYTSVPLQLLGKLIESTGAKVEGFEGSIAGGYRLAKLSYSDEYKDLVIENVDFQYSDFWDATLNNRIVYDNIQIGRADLKIKKTKPATAPRGNGAPSSEGQFGMSREEWAEFKTKWRSKKTVEQFTIKRLAFTQMRLAAPDLPFPIELKEFFIDDLNATPDNLTVAGMKIVSTFFDLNMRGITVTDQSVSLKNPAKGQLRTPLWKGLKKDVPFTFMASYVGGKGKVDLSVMNDQLKIAITPEMMLTVQTQDWTPSEYFQGVPPLQQMNLSAGPMPLAMAMAPSVPFTGDFKLADVRFMVVQNLVEANGAPPAFLTGRSENGPVIHEAYVSPPPLWFQPMPSIRLRSNQPYGAQDLVSQLYLKKTFAESTPEEQTILAQFTPYYTIGDPIFPQLKLPKGSKAAPTAVAKQPAQPTQPAPAAPTAPAVAAQPPSAPSRAPASASAPPAAPPEPAPAAAPAARAVKPKITIFDPKTIPPFRKTPRYPR